MGLELISRHIWSRLMHGSFDHFPKSNLPNENIKITQRQNFWISSDRRFTVTCPKGFSSSLPLDETEYCQQTVIRRKEAFASFIYEGNNIRKIFLEWLGNREIEHAVQITCKRYNSFGRRLADMNAGSMYVRITSIFHCSIQLIFRS